MLDRCRHDREIIGGERDDYLLARAVTRSMVPNAVEYIVTTFYRPPISRRGTTLVPPIIRPEIARARSERGEHLVVYSSGDPAVTEATLARFLDRLPDYERALAGYEQVGNTVALRTIEDRAVAVADAPRPELRRARRTARRRVR